MTEPLSPPEQQPETNGQSTASAPQPRSKLRRLFTYTLIGSTLLLGGLAAGGAWLLGSNSGLHFAVHTLPRLGSTHIETDRLDGTILHGFTAENIRFRSPYSDADISRIELAWQPRELFNRHLHINKLLIGDTELGSRSRPPRPDSKPATLPNSISLPFSIAIDQIETGSLKTYNAAQAENKRIKTEILRGGRATFVYDHQNYTLNLPSLRSPWSVSEGNIRLSTQTPYAIEGILYSEGELDGIAAENSLDITGSLKDLRIEANLIGSGVSLYAETKLHPFATNLADKIDMIALEGENINPHAFMPTLPKARLQLDAHVKPDTDAADGVVLVGTLDIRNDAAAAADQNGIPLRTLAGGFTIDHNGKLDVAGIHAALMQQGSILFYGHTDTTQQTIDLKARIENLTLQDIVANQLAERLDGSLNTTGSYRNPILNWQLASSRAKSEGSLKIATQTDAGQRTLTLEQAKIVPDNGGELQLQGTLELFQDQKLQALLVSKQFNPARLYPDLPEGSVNGSIDIQGLLGKQQIAAAMTFKPSTLSGAQLYGGGVAEYAERHLAHTDLDIRLGNNRIAGKGAYGRRGDTLALDIEAPELHRFGFGLNGALTAKGTLTSTADNFSELDAKLNGSARNFAFGQALKAQNLDFTLNASPDRSRPLDITIKGNGISAGGTAIDNIDTALNGTWANHRFRAAGSLKIDGKPLNLNAAAEGGLNSQNQWQGTVAALDVGGAVQLKLQNAVSLEAGAQRVAIGAARWQALSGSLNLQQFVWDKQNGLQTKGHADNLHLSQLHNFYTPPVEHTLVIAGDWDLRYSQNPAGYLNLRQQSGDVILPTQRKQPLNLSQFVLNTELNQRGILNKFSGLTRYGKTSGNFDILQTFGGNFAQAPVSGRILIDSEDLETLKSFMPVGQNLRGTLKADVAVGGRLAEPQFSGSINGENLHYRNRDNGIILADGSLRSRLEGQRWLVEALTFRRKDGSVTLSGSAAYTGGKPDVDAKVTFDKYQLLDQPTRRLTISGSSDVLYTENGITLNGSLKTDEGRFGFQESTAPELDDDVVILGEQQPEKSAPLPFTLNLVFDLNDRFHFSGQGLNVTLGGALTLTAKPGSNVQAVGSVKIAKGSYKAYGQDLSVTKGIISFVGPLASPNLNIRAVRRGSAVGAGVEVLGNLDAPRVTLVADEPMSEKDKLSWLVLNRASSGSSGDEAAIATAAAAFLAGSLNDKIGLVDDFGLSSQQTRNAQTGEMNPAQQVLTMGKQLTQNLYLGYEAGLQTSSQTVKLVYQLTRSFQGVIRAGTESSGGEIKYIKRFD